MSTHTITVLPGDGIGPEVVASACKVIESSGVRVSWEEFPFGAACPVETNWSTGEKFTPIPWGVQQSIVLNRVALKGPTATPLGRGHRSLNVMLRESFELYANVRPVRTLPGIQTRYSDTSVDVVIFRENLEDLYIGREIEGPDYAEAVSRVSEKGSMRIARFAFEYARHHHRKRVSIIHKANILKKTHGLFLSVAKRVAEEYPEIECSDFIADNFMLQFVKNPSWFDCILAPNFLGDLISDLAAGVVHGSLGSAAGINIGAVSGTEYAIAEAVHGTAPDIAGKGIANPTAAILSGALLLDHLGEETAANRIRNAVELTLAAGEHTGDIRREGAIGTNDFTNRVITRL